MRKKERAEIEKAIALFHEDDGWDLAMQILCKLVGRKVKNPLEGAKRYTIEELSKLSGLQKE